MDFGPSTLRARAAAILQQAAPSLAGTDYKGQGGRVAVIGGSTDFAGAPYYAAMAALRTGAELVYVYTAAEAAPAIKCYSPELMVTPAWQKSCSEPLRPENG